MVKDEVKVGVLVYFLSEVEVFSNINKFKNHSQNHHKINKFV